GTSTPEQGQPYLVALMPLESKVALGVYASEPLLPQGQPEVIRAALIDGDALTAASEMSAHISTPTENDIPLALHDDGLGGDDVAGDNIYSATFTSTEDCGGYAVRVSGTGDTSEGAVIREQLTSFDVQVPGDAIRDPCNPDDDEDGLTDANELNEVGTDPLEPDTDFDEMPDGYEHTRSCLAPLVYDAEDDPDEDGRDNLTEYGTGTNPCVADSGAVGGIAELAVSEAKPVEKHASRVILQTAVSTVVFAAAACGLLALAARYGRRRTQG
ncbi:MAG: hypothetical protein IMZ46_07795, partial [Acidobacteria bacterium]|nr:hypothetical protein [Acidobacteriota bacterium]